MNAPVDTAKHGVWQCPSRTGECSSTNRLQREDESPADWWDGAGRERALF